MYYIKRTKGIDINNKGWEHELWQDQNDIFNQLLIYVYTMIKKEFFDQKVIIAV